MAKMLGAKLITKQVTKRETIQEPYITRKRDIFRKRERRLGAEFISKQVTR